MVTEAIAVRVSKEDEKAEKEARKRAEWENKAKGDLETFR